MKLGVFLFLALACAAITVSCARTPLPVEPTLDEKLARVMKLEDERSSGDGELLARLGAPEGRLRARAALALGRMGDVDAASAIARLLADPSAYVRATAAFALGLLEAPLHDEVRLRLIETLEDEDEVVRGRAAEALSKHGDGAVAEAIATALADRVPRGAEPYDWSEPLAVSTTRFPHFDLRLGLLALARLESLRWSWDLIATEGRTPRFSWWPAAWAASTLRGNELQSLFLFYAGSPDPTLRLYGARGLGGLDRDRSKDHVRLLLFDPNEKVRIEAIRAAQSLGLEELVPDLLSHLTGDTTYVRVEVLRALSRLAGSDTVDPIIDALGSESGWIRAHALAALARQDAESFWLLLSGLGTDPDWHVRSALAGLLAGMDDERARDRLRSMLEDEDPRVRARVLREVAAIQETGKMGPRFIQHLSSEDPFERVAAAEALARVDYPEGLAPLKQAFLVEEEPLAKAGILRAVASADRDAAIALAEAALDDPSFLVRQQAAAVSLRAGGNRVRVRPRPSEHALEEYVELVNPRYTPQAFIETDFGTIEIELFVLDAPMTVRNFIRLAREGFYDGLAFHDVSPNGYVSGGDPRGDGRGGPGYTIRSEINGRPFVRGSVAMAAEGAESAGSRFFVTHLPDPKLDGRYTVFGQVTRGMEVIDRIEPDDVIRDITIWDGVTSPYTDSDAGTPSS